MIDIGLLCAKAKIEPSIILNKNSLFVEFKGALTEQYVNQQLKTIKDTEIFYWSSDNSQNEIDFLVQHNGTITPIEVKAAENLQSKSLYAFITKNKELKGIRFSMSFYRNQDWMQNIPLWAIDI